MPPLGEAGGTWRTGSRSATRCYMTTRRRKLRSALAATFTLVVLTKLVSVPMRLGGAIVSIVPVAGNLANDAIDRAANLVDDVPI
jgi:uncharacterized protein DUF6726